MLRDIEGQQFSDAVKEKLGPRVAIMGERQHGTARHSTALHFAGSSSEVSVQHGRYSQHLRLCLGSLDSAAVGQAPFN